MKTVRFLYLYPAFPFLTVLVAQLSVTAATRYVWQESPSSAPPYTNWLTAAHVIQDAVDVAIAGDEIVVTNGVYQTGATGIYGMSNRLAVTKPVLVRSVNGPEATIIEGYQVPGTTNGDAAVRCVYLADGATLSGFTLTKGATRDWSSATEDWQLSGGGVWCESLNAVVTNCVLVGNSARYHGAGACSGTLSDCTLSGNFAGTEGGGAWSSALNHCSLIENSAVWYGGGAYSSSLTNCYVISNSSVWGGGAERGTLNNCVVTGNEADYGGGADLATLNNCTVIQNSAYQGGGVIGGEVNNCILYYNTAREGSNYLFGELRYCCTTPDPGGIGNMTNEPQLVSASHLAADSPCVGAGSSLYTSGLDIDGEPWRSLPSIGADESHLTTSGELSVGIEASYDTVSVGFPMLLTASVKGPATASAWDFGDGFGATNRVQLAHAWPSPGSYPVVLKVWNGDHPAGIAATALVTVVVAPMHYVNVSNATPVYPYTNWATAASTLQEGVSASKVGGRTVWVADGVYELGGAAVHGFMTNRVALTGGVRLRSVNGPLVTVIKGRGPVGDGAIRCAYVGSDCVLSGFMLTGGATRGNYAPWIEEESGGGVWCESVEAAVSDCVIAGNSAYHGGGGAYDGTLHNCVLMGNSALSGGGVRHGTLNNCTLVGNSDGAFYSTLNNCILYYNGSPYVDNYGGGTLNFCCTKPPPPESMGIGNITNAPLFVDQTGGNLRLQSNSPCINAGNNAYVTTTTDLDGNPRILHGIVDMGAYEFVPLTPAELVAQLIALVNASDLKQKQPLLATLNAALASIERGNCHSAVGQLGAFQNKVQTQVRDTSLARQLIDSASEIIAALDCERSAHVAARIRSLKHHANGRLQLQIEGVTGRVYIVEASTNLVDWRAVGTAIPQANGSFEFEDPDAGSAVAQFYRIRSAQ